MVSMIPRVTAHCLAVLLSMSVASAAMPAGEKQFFLQEHFASLDGWTAFTFPKIVRHSVYTVERHGDEQYLKTESNASASAIVYKKSFHVYEYPRMRWRWKVMNLYSRADPRKKEGDDYPIRIYVMFEFDPNHAGFFERMKYGVARKLYGEYPPHSTLSYVWASREDHATIITSPYTDRAKMVLLEKGTAKVGLWQDEEVNIVDDYRKAFGANPPLRARIALMNDSDNTGEHAVSYIEFIDVFR